MKLVTLISDWNSREPYVSMWKGQLYSSFSDITITDITHDIELTNINYTAFVLRNVFASFPAGSVHLVLTGVSLFLPDNPVVVQHEGHYFVGADTGVFSLLFYETTPTLVRQYCGGGENFYQKMIHLLRAIYAGTLEAETVEYVYQTKIPFVAQYIAAQNVISGNVLHIDSYSNVLTNIPVSLFEQKVKDERFKAQVGSIEITHFHRSYVPDPAPYLIPNSLGVIEIASYKGRLAIIAKWQQDTPVDIFCYRQSK